MTDLEKALAGLRQNGPQEPWTAREVMQTQNVDNCTAIATILNAAVSVDLIPATERDAAVAAALEEAVKKSIRPHSDTARKKLKEAHDKNDHHGATIWSSIVAHLDIVDGAIRALINQPQADALARVRAEAVKVKPLVWHFFDVGHSYGKGIYDANSIRYTYTIQDCGERDFPMRFYVSAISASFAELSDAKAAAQADHDARIRAAIGGVE